MSYTPVSQKSNSMAIVSLIAGILGWVLALILLCVSLFGGALTGGALLI